MTSCIAYKSTYKFNLRHMKVETGTFKAKSLNYAELHIQKQVKNFI